MNTTGQSIKCGIEQMIALDKGIVRQNLKQRRQVQDNTSLLTKANCADKCFFKTLTGQSLGIVITYVVSHNRVKIS